MKIYFRSSFGKWLSRSWIAIFTFGAGVLLVFVLQQSVGWKILYFGNVSEECRGEAHPPISEFDETYLVYSSLIDHLFDHGAVAVNVETQLYPLSPNGIQEFENLASPEMVADFAEKNKTRHVILQEFTSRIRPALTYEISTGRFIDLGPEDTSNRAESTKEIVSFSAIGFNSDRTEAILNTTLTEGSRCLSTLYLMKKRADGRWYIAKESSMR
jgi:hypothetical protein